jgi:hypothetical protein
MGCITVGFAFLDITEDKYVETRMSGYCCFDACNRHEDNPRDEPYRNEYLAHHSKETDEEIGIHAIDSLDVPIVCFEKCYGPC